MSIRILQGNCVEVMKTLPSASVDSVVTDPPYGIGFMGKAWDHADIMARVEGRATSVQSPLISGGTRKQPRRAPAEEAGAYDRSPKGMQAFQAFSRDWAAEALRVLKPGGYLLCFASTRTYHRMACGVEEAGFEVRDQIGWLFGSGFPKSRNLGGDWEGWGSALKPAWEPIVVARKPLVAPNLQASMNAGHCGAINIQSCRVGNEAGRWPANVIHDGSEEVLSAFPAAPGQLAPVKFDAEEWKTGNVYGAMKRGHEPSADSENNGAVGFKMRPGARRLDSGSAARFFYCAKADRADRNAGLDGMPLRRSGMVSNTSGQHITRRDGKAPPPAANHHPTVKPTDLMRYLCRLVTPPSGVVLDPFMGSGSTLKAAELEGFSAIGIELDHEYIEIARRRVVGVAPLLAEVDVA